MRISLGRISTSLDQSGKTRWEEQALQCPLWWSGLSGTRNHRRRRPSHSDIPFCIPQRWPEMDTDSVLVLYIAATTCMACNGGSGSRRPGMPFSWTSVFFLFLERQHCLNTRNISPRYIRYHDSALEIMSDHLPQVGGVHVYLAAQVMMKAQL